MILSDAKTDFTLFLKNYGIWICVGLVCVMIIVLLFLFLFPHLKNKKNHLNNNSDDWIDSLGGRDNINDYIATRSRLTISLKDLTLLKEDKLKEMGVSNIMKMSNKIILVIENKAELIASSISKNYSK